MPAHEQTLGLQRGLLRLLRRGDAPPPGETPPRGARGRMLAAASQTGMLWVLVALLVAAQFLYPGFWAWGNLRNLLAQNAPVGLIALGMTFVMVAGGFDLSVGAMFAAGSVFFADLGSHMPLLAALALTLVLGLALGTINGLVVTRLRVNPFIATLGTASIFSGTAFLYSHSSPIVVSRASFQQLGQGALLGLPLPIWIGAGCFAAGAVVLARSVYGHALYAVGGNREAARLAGLRVDVLRGSTYALVGVLAALSGAILASRLGVGQADVSGSVTLEAIAIVVIGGTSLFGGEGAVWRTAAGLLILGVITNVGDARGWDSNVEEVIKGLIVIGAVALDSLARGRRS